MNRKSKTAPSNPTRHPRGGLPTQFGVHLGMGQWGGGQGPGGRRPALLGQPLRGARGPGGSFWQLGRGTQQSSARICLSKAPGHALPLASTPLSFPRADPTTVAF